MLKILVIDEIQERALDICEGLTRAGHMVAAVLSDSFQLVERIQEVQPDVVLINTDSPSRDTLENLAAMNAQSPRAVLMFSEDSGDDAIRQAMRAGVSSYVVDGLAPERLASLLRVATVHFDEFMAIRRERDDAQRKLTERVIVDRAKGVLMKARGMDEDEAYHALRKLAMERGRKLVEVAEEVLASAKLLLG
jgi:two-component system, response regulator / RNA-binding antiterminator